MASEFDVRRNRPRAIGGAKIVSNALLFAALQVACSEPSLERSRARLSRPADPEKEIFIRDRSVVDDPLRSLDPCDVGSEPLPPWSFGKVLENVAEQAGASDAALFVQNWLDTWRQEQEVNGHLLAPLPIDQLVTVPWLERSGGDRLDLGRAPFRLLAIVNRLDVAQQDGKGEFRMEYVANNVFCQPIRFWIILEFELPVDSPEQVAKLAARWHALGELDFGEAYNAALQQLTDELSTARLKRVNTLETEASVLEWNFRSFALVDGSLVNVPLFQTPDVLDERNPDFISWVNANQEDILADRHEVPGSLLGGDTRNLDWTGFGFEDPIEVRHHFALATCNGCHAGETATLFSHLEKRHRGEETSLSPYLTGESILDPGGVWRTFNELGRRSDYLESLLCGAN